MHDRLYAKSNENVAMHLQVPPQNTPLLWQLNSHKHIGSIAELLRCHTIIIVTMNFMYVKVFRLRRKSHSLLDDPRISNYCPLQIWTLKDVSKTVIARRFKICQLIEDDE